MCFDNGENLASKINSRLRWLRLLSVRSKLMVLLLLIIAAPIFVVFFVFSPYFVYFSFEMLYLVNRLILIAYVKGHFLYIHAQLTSTSGHRSENIGILNM